MVAHSRTAVTTRVVLAGLDGAGKTTAARTVVVTARRGGAKAVLYRNPGGRRTLDNLSRRAGISAARLLGTRGLDAVETLIRTAAVLRVYALEVSGGLILFDRHLYCQLALRRARGLGEGTFLRWLLRVLPAPDLVVYFSVAPESAHRRILARGTDTETIEYLRGLDAAYRSLAEFGTFAVIDANGSPQEVAAGLQAAVSATSAGQATSGVQGYAAS